MPSYCEVFHPPTLLKVAKKRDSKEKVTLPLESKYLSSRVNGDMFVWQFSPIHASLWFQTKIEGKLAVCEFKDV